MTLIPPPPLPPFLITCPLSCEHDKLNYLYFSHRLRYVPNPSPSVFRTTKNNHNILQGVSAPTLRLTQEQRDNFDSWILKNGLRWTAEGGPLAPGGVDVAFVGESHSLFLPDMMLILFAVKMTHRCLV
jgi:hypothetical protein